MTWEQFTDVLPVATLILGYLGSQYTERRKERHEREQIVLQRAADVEGEALLELQDLLIDLPDKWLDHLDRWHQYQATQGGEMDPNDAYTEAVKIGRPYQRASLLASRIVDDTLRTKVQEAIELAYPFLLREVSSILSGFGDYDDYLYDDALVAVDDATEAIGRRLRQPARRRRRRPIG